ncbi:hypothetical protein PanWU01x14_042750 [Parasponia andersonii]|uniref:Uncharacterized protein n=1 Tax=Parasponia andersonii TaxID=3476 RepID=A0A2P5DPU7_PARAD|nr:hypothetical protein PanWU01x14_042750 [Parasponia andersonii]
MPNSEITEVDIVHDNISSNFFLTVDLGGFDLINFSRSTDASISIQVSTNSTSQVSNVAELIDNDKLDDDTLTEYMDEEELKSNGDVDEDNTSSDENIILSDSDDLDD